MYALAKKLGTKEKKVKAKKDYSYFMKKKKQNDLDE
jgi:hypothetical protein